MEPSQSACLETERDQSETRVWRAETALQLAATPTRTTATPHRPWAPRSGPTNSTCSPNSVASPTGISAGGTAHALASEPPLRTAPRRGRAGRCRATAACCPWYPESASRRAGPAAPRPGLALRPRGSRPGRRRAPRRRLPSPCDMRGARRVLRKRRRADRCTRAD